MHCKKNTCIKKMRRQTIDWDKIVGNTASDKGLYPKYTKNSKNSTIRKWTTPFF